MIQTIAVTFAVLWPVSVALYAIALRLLRTRLAHSLWLAAAIALPTSIAATEGAEVYLMGRGLDWLLYYGPAVAGVLGGGTFFFVRWKRRYRASSETPLSEVLATDSTELAMLCVFVVGHMPVVNVPFVLLFDVVAGALALRRRG